MSPRPVVSVVIVSYRSRDALARCLPSLAACAREIPLEVVVVDNDPRDATAAWIREVHPEVRLIANADNLGFTRGVNQGLRAARGEHLFVLNPDCEVGPAALRALLAALERDPATAAAAPALLDDDGRLARSCGRFPNLWTLACDHFGLARAWPRSRLFGGYKYDAIPAERLGVVDWASGAALLIPRWVVDVHGGLDEGIFMYMEEVDWCRRVRAAGLRVRFVPEARIVHVGQQSSRQAPGPSYLHNLRSRVYYFRKHHGAVAARVAQAVLATSLALKLGVTAARPGRAAWARVYARGLRAVWGA